MKIRELLIESIHRTGRKTSAVVGWGRGMGHKGHCYLAHAVIYTANKMGADPYFFVSKTVDEDNPLTPEEKLSIYKTVFSHHQNVFQSATDEMRDLKSILNHLYKMNYKDVIVMVGEDQKDSFKYLETYNGKPNKNGMTGYDFDSITVMSRQESDDRFADEEGPRATPMRDILKDSSASYQEKFKLWRDAMPDELDDSAVAHFMQLAADRMGFPIEQGLGEADNPSFGGAGMGSQSAIPGTPIDLSSTKPTPRQIRAAAINDRNTEKFMGHRR